MLTDLNEIKRLMQAGAMLVSRGDGSGWILLPDRKPNSRDPENPTVSSDLVALLTAQGFIKTELRLVGSATWVEPAIRVGAEL